MISCQNDNSFCSANQAENKAILVAGPTACGKSGLALSLAEKINGVIVNADSMQIYSDVPTLTARPTPAETQKIDHRLYGFLEPNESFSVFKWAQMAADNLQKIWQSGKIPVVVGGTGLYFQTLVNGLSPVPETLPEIRALIRNRFESMGAEAFAAAFKQKDPDFALTDPQRLLRAAEVLEQTGQSITVWQTQPHRKLVEADWCRIFLNPRREELYRRCHDRFDLMMQGSAVEEVKVLLAKNPPADSPVMKAIGVAEITALLQGKLSQRQAVEKARQMTRNYAKRQMTWFTHRYKADFVVFNHKTDSILTNVLHFLS